MNEKPTKELAQKEKRITELYKFEKEVEGYKLNSISLQKH
jgi:hypothetical protein